MEAKVSIIVPVYKVEKYLKKCVNSILKQTYKNLEVILVDDGSPDKCPKMCDDFAKKDLRIKVIHKENEGVSVARNVGIDRATGEYIVFVDSDDWLPLDAITRLVLSIESTASDFAMGSIRKISFLNSDVQRGYDNFSCFLDDDNGMISFLECIYPGPCGKIYKSKIIRESNIYFPTGIKYGEDTIFLWKYIKKCNNIYSLSDIVYYYNRLVKESATKKYFPQMHIWYKECMDNLIQLLDKFLDQQTAKHHLTKTLLDSFVFALKYHAFANVDSQKKIEIFKEIWELFKPLLTDARYIKKDLLEENQVFDLCKKNRFEESYDLLIKEKPKDDFLRKIKRVIKKVVISIKRACIFGM